MTEQPDALAETIGAVWSDLVTKRDLSESRPDLKAEMTDLKSALLEWISGAIGFRTLVIGGAGVTLSRLAAR